jgi:hypothetical protein
VKRICSRDRLRRKTRIDDVRSCRVERERESERGEGSEKYSYSRELGEIQKVVVSSGGS